MGEYPRTDDLKVQMHIDWAWWQYRVESDNPLRRLEDAFRLLQAVRREPERSKDLNLAAAEHYLLARNWVANAVVNADQMRLMVLGYESLKSTAEKWHIDWAFQTTEQPTARASPDSIRWGLKGVEDGERDRKTHNTGTKPPGWNSEVLRYGGKNGYY